ncbi:hypothetical protein pneo_cds_800 [Pandoravirus neocaledonia]|uniref:F-box incomplete domain containing protein n=1 Tax=Pandoravirus neocaledonia TaxID=2107708 RepID=A0A2U7UDA4_9VIRU|nr:hypothetical protein pneo_cds_800 [Pandoravirus neocaledonia]AVK76407.1 hypothetical protein pneo_cds_800 [Pandoravirus neocaledonia]
MHAMDHDDNQKACALIHLPPELRAHVTDRIRSLRDIVACAQASSGILTRPTVREIFDRLPRPIKASRLLKYGAPPLVLADLFALASIRPTRPMLPNAVAGGRLDSLRWFCERTRHLGRGAPHPSDDGHVCPCGQDPCLGGAAKGVGCPSFKPARKAIVLARSISRLDLLDCLVNEQDVAGPAGVRILSRMNQHAAQTGDLDFLAYWHERNTPPDGGCCHCDAKINKRALAACRVDVIKWLCEVDCSAAMPMTCATIARVLTHGLDDKRCVPVIDWIASVLVPGDADAKVMRRAAINAVKYDFVERLSRVHALGLVEVDSEAIACAFVNDSTRVLKWAAAAAIPAWSNPLTGYAAARYARKATLRWFLSLPGAACVLSVGAVKSALEAGRVGMAIAVHQADIVPFDRYDAAAVACEHLTDDQAARVIKAGAPCTAAALAFALRGAKMEVLRIAADTCDAAQFQAALDSCTSRINQGIIAWLTANVDGICVAEHRRAAPFRYKPESLRSVAAWENALVCPCPSCRG